MITLDVNLSTDCDNVPETELLLTGCNKDTSPLDGTIQSTASSIGDGVEDCETGKCEI